MSQAQDPTGQLRASDADRERIVELLRQSAAEGRITMDEFEQRMTAAYEARTYADLAGLTADLPVDLGTRARSGPAAGSGEPRDAIPTGGLYPAADYPGRSTPYSGRDTVSGLGGAASDVVGAMLGAASDVRARREMRRQRHERRLARRAALGPAGALISWASLSLLLTGIWLLQFLGGGHAHNHFWPIWPIGIIGLIMLRRFVKRLGGRG